MTPLHVASRRGNEEVVALLLWCGADVTMRSSWGTPLHCAAMSGSAAVVLLLLEYGADKAAIGMLGGTPLYCARVWKHPELEALLR